MYTPIFLLLWYVGGHYMDVTVFGQIGGGGQKKKYSDMWMLSLAKLRFISMLMTDVKHYILI